MLKPPDKSGRPGLKQIRAVYRLVGECRDLGSDPNAWRARMLEGLCLITGARVGLYLHLHDCLHSGERLSAPMDRGFLDDAQRALWSRYQEENAQADDPFHLAYYGNLKTRLCTRSLRSVVDLPAWYRSRHYNDFVRASGLGDRITSSLRLSTEPDGPLQVVVLHRDAADGWFPRSASRLIRLFHHELSLSLGDRLTLPGTADDRSTLPPRLSQVLRALLDGMSDKEIAKELGISPHTVNIHVQRLYRHFGVHSRVELYGVILDHPRAPR
ncbi:MAG: hypothetical protein FIA97_19665 [Methylococcaceae bacterium]|nr:hypothetical protein [Methylococcaceae bacterium]